MKAYGKRMLKATPWATRLLPLSRRSIKDCSTKTTAIVETVGEPNVSATLRSARSMRTYAV